MNNQAPQKENDFSELFEIVKEFDAYGLQIRRC